MMACSKNANINSLFSPNNSNFCVWVCIFNEMRQARVKHEAKLLALIFKKNYTLEHFKTIAARNGTVYETNPNQSSQFLNFGEK